MFFDFSELSCLVTMTYQLVIAIIILLDDYYAMHELQHYKHIIKVIMLVYICRYMSQLNLTFVNGLLKKSRKIMQNILR